VFQRGIKVWSQAISPCPKHAHSLCVFAGALFGTGQSHISVFGCRFEGLSAMYGSAAFLLDNSSLSMSDSVVLGNTAAIGAGVACGGQSSLTVSSSLFQGNNASTIGGGIAVGDECKVGLLPT
jgi:predicted outer membrane repeat protein